MSGMAFLMLCALGANDGGWRSTRSSSYPNTPYAGSSEGSYFAPDRPDRELLDSQVLPVSAEDRFSPENDIITDNDSRIPFSNSARNDDSERNDGAPRRGTPNSPGWDELADALSEPLDRNLRTSRPAPGLLERLRPADQDADDLFPQLPSFRTGRNSRVSPQGNARRPTDETAVPPRGQVSEWLKGRDQDSTFEEPSDFDPVDPDESELRDIGRPTWARHRVNDQEPGGTDNNDNNDNSSSRAGRGRRTTERATGHTAEGLRESNPRWANNRRDDDRLTQTSVARASDERDAEDFSDGYDDLRDDRFVSNKRTERQYIPKVPRKRVEEEPLPDAEYRTAFEPTTDPTIDERGSARRRSNELTSDEPATTPASPSDRAKGPGRVPTGSGQAGSAKPTQMDTDAELAATSTGERIRQQLSDRPWWPLMIVVVGLFASIAFNVWLGWIAWDLYTRYQDAMADVQELEGRLEERPLEAAPVAVSSSRTSSRHALA